MPSFSAVAGLTSATLSHVTLRLKIWSFLKPRIVRVSPVVHAIALEKDKLDAFGQSA